MSLTKSKRANALPPPPHEVLENTLGVRKLQIEWLAGDGSDRCYYRLRVPAQSSSLVLMQLSGQDADALKVNGYDWIKVAAVLEKNQIPYPALKFALPDYAALIIEDYGDIMLETRVKECLMHHNFATTRDLYQKCYSLIGRMLKIERNDSEVWCKRRFDIAKYKWELEFFLAEYLEPTANISLSATEKQQFALETLRLCEFLEPFSRFFVHRDFHSRNIMVKSSSLAVIDFQDARLGAAAYDLVSLFYDNYVPFTLEQRAELFAVGLDTISQIAGEACAREIKKQVGAVLLQRQLKAIGTYGYLTMRKRRGNYLPYVRPAIESLSLPFTFNSDWTFLSRELVNKLCLTMRGI